MPGMMGKAPKPKPKPKASQTPGLPSLEEFKQSAAYKTNSMTYKEYLAYFKARRGGK